MRNASTSFQSQIYETKRKAQVVFNFYVCKVFVFFFVVLVYLGQEELQYNFLTMDKIYLSRGLSSILYFVLF